MATCKPCLLPHSPRRPPLPRQTLESKAHIPAKVTVKVPKDLFSTATQSGNHHLVQRTVLESLEKRGPLSVGETLLKAGIKQRVPAAATLKRPAQAEGRRPFKEEAHFDSESGSSFPPKCAWGFWDGQLVCDMEGRGEVAADHAGIA